MSYVPLHVHSHYSLLSALPKIPDLVEAAKEAGIQALALTDNGNLYGAIDFYKECTKAGIKPIIGIDAYVALPPEDTSAEASERNAPRLVLLAETQEGYANLLSLITKGNLEAADDPNVIPGKPHFTRALLHAHAKGLIAIAPARNGELSRALARRDRARAERLLAEYQDIFGKENVFLELSHHDEIQGHRDTMREVISFATEKGAPLVAAHEVFYLLPEHKRAWETMRKIESRDADTGGLTGEDEEDFSFRSPAYIAELFADTPEALENTQKIADRCTVELTIGKFVFPHFPLPPGKTEDDALKELCLKGLTARGLGDNEEARKRLEYELDIIKFKGYAAYFLVVEDLIRFAREKNIYTNIRGSVAGSMTTYVLQITKIDPLAYQIPFERFLNPERPSAPDIDMDFADTRRDEVIDYARAKYGADHVAQIGTFGTMLARGVVRDVARALGYPYGLGDRIAKEIPMGSQGFPMTLDRALEENPDLGKLYKADDEVQEIIDLGKIIEGCARHISVHAAGVVISPRPLGEYAPLQRDPKGGKIITQYDMYSVGEDGVGLTKFDFLGIRNLTILASAVDLVKRTRGETIDIETIPLDDPKTFEMLARGDTEATFQLNGSGMTRFLKELRPSSIHDINAMVALYRPGPMQFIPNYIERKHNPRLISYLDPAMEPILKQTYGILVYQDDLLIMANKLAGYSWGEVDKFRKAVGKKIPEEMAKQKEKFIEGCVTHSSWPRAKAERIWAWIEPFAAYGFNKAHSASYGRVAYQTAYMKANYPVEYMSAVLTAEAGNIDTVSIMVSECKRMGIEILPPSINESLGDFTAIPEANNGKGAIRFGLYSIKNFGSGVADAIIAERNAHGPFTSISDFLRRIKDKNLNKRGLESLIKCGALDTFGERGTFLEGLELMLQYHREHALTEAPQDSLFSLMGGTSAQDIALPKVPDAPMGMKLAWEKELLGLYVSGHPLDKHKELLAKRTMDIRRMKEVLRPGVDGVAAGIIREFKPILTRKGDQMAFMTVADFDDAIEAVVFPKLFAQHKELLKPENCIKMKGKLTSRNGELSFIVEALKPLETENLQSKQ